MQHQTSFHLDEDSGFSSQPSHHTISLQLPRISTMAPKSLRKQASEGALSVLNVFIEGLNLAKEIASVTPAKAAFGSAAVLLTMIRVSSLSIRVYLSVVG